MKKSLAYMLLLLIVGCTEPYDVDLGSAGPGLAVEGSVTTDSAYQQVILTQTANYFYNKPAEGINTASVSVTFNGHTVAYNYVEGSRGVYQSAYAFKGKEGTRYTLYIDSVSFNGGDTYQSYVASDSMCSIIPIDSISVDYDDPIEAWWIRIYTLEPGDTENWYIFKAGINNHLVTDTISEWNHTIDKFLNGEYLYGVDVQYLQDEYDDERPSVGDTIWLYMENVSEGYHDFCEQVQTEIEPKIPLFSGQPANVSSNVLPNGVGFFSAVAKTKQYRIVTELPYEGYDQGK